MESEPRREDRPGAAAAPARRTERPAGGSDAGDGGAGGAERGGDDGPRQPTTQDDPLYRDVPDDRVGG